MNKYLLDLLACPNCGSADLVLEPPSEEFTITQGVLSCPSCAAKYPVSKGIPQMLPPQLTATLEQKGDYLEMLQASMVEGRELSPHGNTEVDRFMWEHQLYNWGKEVIYKDPMAAEIFSSYAEKGARGLCQLLKERANGVDGKGMLYVGSGNDHLVSAPLEEGGAFLVNMDIVSEPLEDLVEAGAKNCVCGDVRRLPFRPEAFDVVFSKGSVHHSHPIDEPLREMAKVVKRGGHILVAEPNKYTLSRLPRFLLPNGFGCPTPYENAISARQVVSILSQEGISQFQIAALTCAAPGVPSPLARLWEGLDKAMPRLFDRFAFEFIVYGKKCLED